MEPGQLLFAWAGSRGVSFGPSIWDGPKGVLNQHIFKVTPGSGVHPRWLFDALQVATARIERKAHGFKSTLLHVHKADITEQIIYTPPLPEQIAIANILQTWERAISLTEYLIASKLEQRKGLMHQLLSGKRRFPGFTEPWRACALRDVCTRLQRKNSVGNTNVLTISGQQGLVNQQKFFTKRVASEDLSGYFLIHRGDFAYNKSTSNGYPYGAIKRLENYDAGVVSVLYITFALTSPECDTDFMAHFFEAGGCDRGIYQIAHEGARSHGLLNVSPGDFFRIKLHLPSLDEQKRIAGILNMTNTEISLLRDQLAALKEQKKGLMQQLLTGKRRVKITEETA